MTSVQNRQRPSNGNKKGLSLIFACCVLLCLQLTSCDVFNKMISSPKEKDEKKPIILEPAKKNDDRTGSTNQPIEQIEPKNGVKADTTFQISGETNRPVDLSSRKMTFNVLVLLPFNTTKNTTDFYDNKIDAKSKIALEYYNGMLIALQELARTQSLNFNVRVFDTKINGYHTKGILQSMESYPIDLIIGPVFSQCLREAEKWAKTNKTMLVSPLASKLDFVKDNPYFVSMNPDLSAQVAKINDFLLIEKRTSNYFIVANPLNLKEMQAAEEMKRMATQSSRIKTEMKQPEAVTVLYKTAEEEGNSSDDWKSYFLPGRENHVVIVSNDENFVTDAVRQITVLSDHLDFTIYGTDNWRKFRNISLDQLNNLNCHLTTNYFDNPLDMNQAVFNRNYASIIGAKPTEFACRAYDITNYLFTELSAEHLLSWNFADLLLGEKKGFFSNIKFDKSDVNLGKQVDYIGNKGLLMVHYDNYEFKIAR